MCWNEEVSLNTFVFSAGTLAFVLYNNYYTQYKIKIFDNIFLILFIVLVISVQLVEFFLWMSLKNKDKSMNRIWSIIGYIVIFLQPIVTVMWITNNNVRNILLSLYLTIYGLSWIFKPIRFEAVKHKSGHLLWLFTQYDKKMEFKNLIGFARSIIWALSFFTGFYYLLPLPIFIIGMFITLSIVSYSIYSHNWEIFNSNWCWLANGISLLIAFYLLFVLPYKEYMSIC